MAEVRHKRRMTRRATITLYLDPGTYREETGERLTKRTLDEIGRMVNEDCASIYGYESWETKFVNLPERRR